MKESNSRRYFAAAEVEIRYVALGSHTGPSLSACRADPFVQPGQLVQKLGAVTVENDNDGNITCIVSSPCPQFSYDVRGHLPQVQVLPSVFVDYSYDTFGRRYQVTAVAGSTTTNQYDGFNILGVARDKGVRSSAK